MSKLPSAEADLDSAPLSSADRVRLVHSYLTSTPHDGGLGIIPGCREWGLVQSVMALHDHEFNDRWIRLWTRHRINSVELEQVRYQFGESVALYFVFLNKYTRALAFPSVLGVLFYFFGTPYSVIFSTLLFVWSVVFVEWWRLQERILSVRWHTRGSFRVEKRRADFIPGFPWWKKEARKLASIPIILLFSSALAVVLTGLFVLESFVTELYTGPGHRIVAFSPTLLFSTLVPQLFGVYKTIATRYTDWENHAHQSSHASSFSIKVFTLSAINSYLGLALTGFVYVPFGERVMSLVQHYLLSGPPPGTAALFEKLNINLNYNLTLKSAPRASITKTAPGAMAAQSLFEADAARARLRLNPSKLQDQIFAFSVTTQILDNIQEITVPFIMRAIGSFRAGKGFGNGHGKGTGKKKRVAFDDEPAGQCHDDTRTREEREFLETVRSEVALPDYDTFDDYSEMVTQFGYVALWSTIWPLAPLMSFLNNFIEARSDAFKITVHVRRPIPIRTDTIGPWMECLSFLAWLSSLTNSALVYMFRTPFNGSAMDSSHESLSDEHVDAAIKDLLVTALLVALLASHVYFVLRAGVRHALELAIWRGSKEMKEAERVEREIKEKYLAQCPTTPLQTQFGLAADEQNKDDWTSFWATDEGLDEIQKSVKDA